MNYNVENETGNGHDNFKNDYDKAYNGCDGELIN